MGGSALDEIIERDCLEYIKKVDMSPLIGKTVFITGANGLIGTYLIYMLHLANVTQNAGINIIALSRNPPCDKLYGIFSGRYKFYAADLLRTDFSEIPEKADYIIHGATYAQPGKFLKNYYGTIQLNTTVTERILQKAKRDGAAILYLSSSEVYGDPDEENIPTPEEYPGFCSPVGIRAIYSESKRMGETLCFAYRNFEAVNAKIARISMTYGPGVSLNDERVLAHFLKQALTENRITMLDDGSKVRTFCYIADCALMLLYILLYGASFVYNVGGKDRITIKNLAEEICLLTGSRLDGEVYGKLPEQDIKISPKHVELDINKICSEFGLPPFIPFREGLARTIEWNLHRQLI